jgi:light-regulated signal transduction histidine kinase (bacteriophytochrome)
MYKLFNLPKKIKPTPHIYYNYTSEKEQPIVDRIVNCITRDFIAFEETISVLSLQKENRVIKIKAMAILDKTKKPVKMVGVDLDITSQVKANQKIKQLNETLVVKNRDLQELNRELRTFNKVTSNDYKETLSILYTNLEYIITTDARRLSDSSKANIRRAQSAIQRMKLLTDDINSYLQLHDVGIAKSLVDPNAILKNVTENMERKILERNASVESVMLPHIHADPFLVFHLFRHLINNAIKFSRITVVPVVKIKYSRADEINNIPGSKQNTPYVIISISDNGLGFHEEESERLFDLFFRNEATKNAGSGIGLAVCKKIMSMHGGFIVAEGAPGVGATFNCYFPDEEIEEGVD